MEYQPITEIKEKPAKQLIKIKFIDTEKEYISIFLYNISKYFKMMLDNDQVPEFDESLIELIENLSINIKFKVKYFEQFIIFCDYIQATDIFQQIYDYLLKVEDKYEHLIPIVFNHITKEQKIKLFEKYNDINNISNTDLVYICLNSKKIEIETLKKAYLVASENDLKQLEKLIKEKKQLFQYKLCNYRRNIMLRCDFTNLTGKHNIIFTLSMIDNHGNPRNCYFDDNDPEVSLLEGNLQKVEYNNIIKNVLLMFKFELIPIIDQCIKDQNIQIIE